MMRAGALAALLALTATAAAADDDRFNLDCQTQTHDLRTGSQFSFERRLAVDIPGGKFCFLAPDATCDYVYPITALDRTSITYDYDVTKDGPDHKANQYRVGRVFDLSSHPSRDHIVIARAGSGYTEDLSGVFGDAAAHVGHPVTQGTCTRTPFTPAVFGDGRK